jgi:hypothetical protein
MFGDMLPAISDSIFSDFFSDRDFDTEVDRKLFRPLMKRVKNWEKDWDKVWNKDWNRGWNKALDWDKKMDIENLDPNTEYAEKYSKSTVQSKGLKGMTGKTITEKTEMKNGKKVTVKT